MNAFDRFTLSLAPRWTLERLRARAAAGALTRRNYEAASVGGRRTANWTRTRGDVNSITALAIAELRMHARDLVRNNAWAKKAQRVIANNVVGWGIVPKASSTDTDVNAKAAELWKAWADSTECESEGRHTFAGLQHLALKSIVESGEVLIRRRPRRAEDGLTIPLQLQVLESDYLDTSKDDLDGLAGGPIVQGVEFDKVGRRAAYWIFPEHPGSSRSSGGDSRRIPASEILHVFYSERPGQARGVSWLGTAIVNMKDLDEFEDAELVRQKIAACFAAFVTDTDGTGAALGEQDTDPLVETFEPGMVVQLPPGKSVTMASPPGTTTDSFASRQLRRIAAALGITYEDLTGDYSQVNYSSARMARLVHQANVRDWQAHMMIPLLCAGVWRWAMDAAVLNGDLPEAPSADWTVPPLPMIEPDKEGLAYSRLIRNGIMTPSEAIREQGGDPDSHFIEYAADMKRLDELGIKLDADVRAVSQAGLTQVRVGAGSGGDTPPKDPPADDTEKKPIPEKTPPSRAEPVMLDVRGPLELLRSK